MLRRLYADRSMTLSDKAIEDLREILCDEFEREFTRDETAEVGARLLTLIQRLLRPLPHENGRPDRPPVL